MEELSNLVNDKHLLGSVIVDGVTYYVDINRNIFIKNNDEFEKVEDTETLKKILEYITPKSIDVKDPEEKDI